jgi:hypothetical protein
MRVRWTTILVLAGVAAACAPNGTVATPAQESPTTTTTEMTTTTLPPVVECPGEGDFEEGGGIADIDGTGSDSHRLAGVSWETSDLCESFELRFETAEGAPATTVPTTDIDHLPSFQVVRITMNVEATVLTDQIVETSLVDRLYVVRSLDGGMFVDLHLTEPAAVRASADSSPARLVVDLRPGLVPFEGGSIVAENVVVVAPTPGASVAPQTTVTGYARTVEANVVMTVTQDAAQVSETSTTAADYLETWGEFSLDAVLPPGQVSLFVGETSPEDGDPVGVTFDLTVN